MATKNMAIANMNMTNANTSNTNMATMNISKTNMDKTSMNKANTKLQKVFFNCILAMAVLMGLLFAAVAATPSVAFADNEQVTVSLYQRHESDNAPFALKSMVPGDTQTQEYCVQVSHQTETKLTFSCTLTSDTSDLASKIEITVTLPDTGETIYQGRLKSFENTITLPARAIPGSDQIVYAVTAKLPTSVGNAYQSQTALATFLWSAQGGLIPQTGNQLQLLLWLLILAAVVSFCVIVYSRRKAFAPQTGAGGKGAGAGVGAGAGTGTSAGAIASTVASAEISASASTKGSFLPLEIGSARAVPPAGVSAVAVSAAAASGMANAMAAEVSASMGIGGVAGAAGTSEGSTSELAPAQKMSFFKWFFSPTKQARTARISALLVAVLFCAVCVYATAIAPDRVENNEFTTGNLSVNINGGQAVFAETDGLFEPGYTAYKEFYIENAGSVDAWCSLWTATTKGELSRYVDCTLKVKQTGAVLYSGRLADFTQAAAVDLPDVLPAGQKVYLTMALWMPTSQDNTVQATSAEFDIKLFAVQSRNNPDRLS